MQQILASHAIPISVQQHKDHEDQCFLQMRKFPVFNPSWESTKIHLGRRLSQQNKIMCLYQAPKDGLSCPSMAWRHCCVSKHPQSLKRPIFIWIPTFMEYILRRNPSQVLMGINRLQTYPEVLRSGVIKSFPAQKMKRMYQTKLLC